MRRHCVLVLSLVGGILVADVAHAAMSVKNLRWDGRAQPFGFLQFEPRLSWAFNAKERGQRQTAYQVVVASDPKLLLGGKADVWDSGKVTSATSVNVPYGGPAPKARQRGYWSVRVWDKDDKPSPYARPASWELGLYDEEWMGAWIGRPNDAQGYAPSSPLGDRSVTYLRKRFTLPKGVRLGRIYASGFGVYELSLNGKRVGDNVLAPGYTTYEKRALFQTYDATKLLTAGDNVLGAIVAGGWCTAGLGGVPGECKAEAPRVMLQLEATLSDGESIRVVSDDTWRASPGPIEFAHLCDGESYDARKEQTGWDTVKFDDKSWAPASLYDTKRERDLMADPGAGMRVTQEIKPVAVKAIRPGVFVFDMGQNIVGWARLQTKATAGTTLTMRFAEAVNADGSLALDNLQGCLATDRYIAKTVGTQTWAPRFTVHGFRYVQVEGLQGTPTLGTVVGRVVHSEMAVTGRLETSSKDLNQLISNIDWSLRGGFLSVPTSAPAGGARLGSMLQGRAFASTACLLRDTRAMLRKWTDDIRDMQLLDATYSDVSPAPKFQAGGPGSGSAGVLIPFALFNCYVDHQHIDKHLASMGRWLDLVVKRNPDFIWKNGPGQIQGDLYETGPRTDPALIGTAELVHASDAIVQIARHRGAELASYAQKYAAVAEAARAAFAKRFVANDGRLTSQTQTAYALALAMDLLPAAARTKAAQDFVALIERDGFVVNAGVLGAAYILPALSRVGRTDVAYRLLTQTSCPSWLCSLKSGATTIWQTLSSPKAQTSLNDVAFGAVGAWLFDSVGGIALDSRKPGGGHVVVAPQPGAGVTWAKGSYDSSYGPITTNWRLDGKIFTLTLSVPPNATASVTLPVAGVTTEGGRPVAHSPGVRVVPEAASGLGMKLGVDSGRYEFKVQQQ